MNKIIIIPTKITKFLDHRNLELYGIICIKISVLCSITLICIVNMLHYRIGRSGRFGRKGVAINLITQDDNRKLRDIEVFYNTAIQELPRNIIDLIN